MDLCNEAGEAGAPCWNMTIKGSTHHPRTDFAVLYFNMMSLFIKRMANGRRTIYLTVTPPLEFLQRYSLPNR